MKELLATNDPVTLSLVCALLEDSGMDFIQLDQNMSILEGSIGVIPRRIMVADDHYHSARRLVADAGLAKELKAEQ